jgi:hypothetical protein
VEVEMKSIEDGCDLLRTKKGERVRGVVYGLFWMTGAYHMWKEFRE